MRSQALQKPLDLQKGLFLIRYDSAEDSNQPPKVAISVDKAASGQVEFLLPPDVEMPVLWSPGAALVVRISAPVRLLVEVTPRFPGGSVAARIQSSQVVIDPLGLAWSDDVSPVDFSTLRLLGHLAGRGDTLVGVSEWLGGPMTPTRIEGVAVEWPGRPANFNLRHAVRIGGQGELRNTEFVEAGGYAGTRGRALPVVGATFEISGAAANGYQVTADALFLGSPQMRVSGQRIVLAGPTGREPLVGLRLRIASVEEEAVAPKVNLAPPAEETNSFSNKKAGRVRVFRSSAKTATA